MSGDVEYASIAGGMQRPQRLFEGLARSAGMTEAEVQRLAAAGRLGEVIRRSRARGGSRSYDDGPTAAQAMAQLEERKRRWDAEEDERYWRAYMAEGQRLRRPDPAACMRRLLVMRRGWLSDEQR